EGIRYLGYLNNPHEAFSRATVFAAPHRFAAGVQTKVLQALDAGLPVVTTPLVRDGLEPIPPDLLRVGLTAEEIAAEIVALSRDRGVAGAGSDSRRGPGIERDRRALDGSRGGRAHRLGARLDRRSSSAGSPRKAHRAIRGGSVSGVVGHTGPRAPRESVPRPR